MGIGIEVLELLVLASALVAMLARRMHVPYSVGLALAGITFGLLHWGAAIPMPKEFLYEVLLPPLVFDAAFHLEWKDLRQEIVVVLVLATLGLVVSAAVTAAGMHWLAGWDWIGALLFGALIAATDPVAVVGAMRDMGVLGRSRLLLEAESLFNDGSAAVAFSVLLLSGGTAGIEVMTVGKSLALVLGGSLLCGVLVGVVAWALIARSEDHLVETTFAMVAAFGSFLLAEKLHLSGVLATMTAGLLMNNLLKHDALSNKGRSATDATFEYATFVANSLIFLLIGLQEAQRNFAGMAGVLTAAILLTLAGRAVAVYLNCVLFQRILLRVSFRDQHILVWGGLRGALALALAINLPGTISHRDEIISATFAIVAFSIFVQGLTIKPVIRWLGISTIDAP